MKKAFSVTAAVLALGPFATPASGDGYAHSANPNAGPSTPASPQVQGIPPAMQACVQGCETMAENCGRNVASRPQAQQQAAINACQNQSVQCAQRCSSMGGGSGGSGVTMPSFGGGDGSGGSGDMSG